ncbi:F-box protein [Aspergillus alliaceus]|uniref:F-box protein n=1 Tax=Petromyces alliaceus TaxID=209559 RepID=UPI0012A3BE51|nr:uncharacterized protein BDW43DRAFT_311573 [Aspergillus alliaceus]KAB8233173.1 hypothetical protein BDW43DRAFT_311573 [Aspergillus alliaceus]
MASHIINLLQRIKPWTNTGIHNVTVPLFPPSALNLANLPPELLHYIISYLDRESVKQSRLTCRNLSYSATISLFRRIVLFPNDASCQNMERILESTAIKSVCHDHDTPAVAKAVLPTQVITLIQRLKELPNLRDVALRFDANISIPDDDDDDDVAEGVSAFWHPETVEFRLETLRLLFSSLLSLSRPLRGLAIQSMQNVCEQDDKEIAIMALVLCKLQSLRLNIIQDIEYSDEDDLLLSDTSRTFYPELTTKWLKPTVGTLQNLCLWTNEVFGFYPKMLPMHFPHLKSLTLGKYCFVHDSQLDWILSHAATLRELYLYSCVILYEVRICKNELHQCYLSEKEISDGEGVYSQYYAYTYPKRWSNYFDSFRNELVHLGHFRFGGNTIPTCEQPFEQDHEIKVDLYPSRYSVFDQATPQIYMPVLQDESMFSWPSVNTLDDAEALLGLLKRTGQDSQIQRKGII